MFHRLHQFSCPLDCALDHREPIDGEPEGEETSVTDAIAAQEEHLKRSRACLDTLGRAHSFDRFAAAPGAFYRACTTCLVTETHADYLTKGAHR